MKIRDIFFWVVCFFLVGVLVASAAHNFTQAYLISILIIALLVAMLFAATHFLLLPLPRGVVAISLAMFLGAGYFFTFNYFQQDPAIIFDKKVEITGTITEAEQRLNSQVLRIDNIQFTTSRYPEFRYGDKIKVLGIITRPEGEFADYYQKEGILGLIGFPKAELLSHETAPSIKGTLFKIKDYFIGSFKKVLPFEQAAFLSGLTLGDTSEFSDEFKEKLRLTGTTHLVALSGYNISIIIRYVGGFFALWWVTKKWRLPLSILVVIGFVVMTGAEPSVVRAAIMAMILILADRVGRVAYIPNVMATAALAMTLINPKILAFDIGFQLSFVALVGLIYLEPWLRKKFKVKNEPGFFSWRSNFWTTTSAQLAVLPIIIYHFGFISPVSILTNVLLLEFIPITMGLGFFIGFAAIVGYWFSWVIALPVQVFLGYELTIIGIFSKILSILM
ncbi:MAG: internalization-related competence protein ComEC/Rec2 protein [Parcubacteria group bacterium GW2011_GWA2_47_8b]|uniref:Internalization-related competence protein ComEC/Rec2 protein n=3 Tax=Parcubacteria group TaxID=1794811 RepID=A0A0G1W3U9_9BACT|nr:MAG: internalization-related competence protein ComEC/Rec2 protein [Candidatus Giovannonibacteria bacterium GW2011_GWB1_47_6b]KKU85057.1 MAG: internalization-related competence protein ComEC/Rec2 protein [Parcubacteria group bacterium GW2011_GWA2_47_8b]OGY64469.1 MAG: hypothetical protein A3E64_02565 [Candidatus Harrisonbacteria bacterium RIFCSPHIGHO2_12_FULL_48_16]OGY68414.1 MAG: hypothetical protein A2214_00950 [Candidatus Harrisonbacteria bacterium RIFOXYA1_FULL_48_8]